MKKTIAIVSPFYNEQRCVQAFFDAIVHVVDSSQLAEFTFHLICVDDGSTDDTLALLRSCTQNTNQKVKVTIVSLARNFGHQIALSAGIDQACGCDAAILMDSDLQHPPELIPELLRLWREGYDIVQTVRQDTENVSLPKKLSSNLFYAVFNVLSDVPIMRGAADFCLLDKKVIDVIHQMPERHRFLRGLTAWCGFKRVIVPYVAKARKAGQSKYTVRKMFALALDAVFSFSSRPAKLATWLGFVLVILGLMYGIYIVGGTLLGLPFVRGWPSILCTSLLLNGVTLVVLGIQGQYLARIFEEVKRRPLYTIQGIFGKEPDK